MKTILLWDQRFPDRKPVRLVLDDAVASAAVRAGVATAANPSEAGALSAGGPLDPTMLTEVLIQHGYAGEVRRAFLPYSVVMIGALAGVLASIGTPIAGGVAPTPTPTPAPAPLVATPANPKVSTAIAENSAISLITGAQAAGVPSLSPNDGRVKFDGDATNGYVIRKGASAISAGILKVIFSVTGQQPVEITIEISQASNTITPIMNPVVATWGGSKMRQSANVYGGDQKPLLTPADNLFRPHSTTSWGSIGTPLATMDPRVITGNWAAESRSPENSRDMNGLFFAADGNGFDSMLLRATKLLASDANIVLFDLTSNSWTLNKSDTNIAAYVAQATTLINLCIAAGKIVGIQSAIPKGTGTGNPFNDYPGSPRFAVQNVNAYFEQFAKDRPTQCFFYNGWKYTNDTVNSPYKGILGMFREDYGDNETHLTGRGNNTMARNTLLPAIAPYIHPDSLPSTRRIGANGLTNADFTSAEAISTARINGQKPVGYSLDLYGSATSTATNWTTSMVDAVTPYGTRTALRIQGSGMANMPTDADMEGIVITMPNVAMTKDTYTRFEAWVRFLQSYDGWRTWGGLYFQDPAGCNVFGNNGGSSDGIPSGTANYTVPWFANETIRPHTNYHRVRTSGTSQSVKMTFVVSRGTGAVDFLVFLPELSVQADPKLLMINEADTRAPAITSPSTFNMLETNVVPPQLVGNKPMFWAVDGGVGVDTFGRVGAPADIGSYTFNVTATPMDHRDPLVVQSITVNVNADPNVFTDKFNYADGALSSEWTRLEPTGGVAGFLVSGAKVAQVTSGGDGYTMLRAPQRGDTNLQRITYSRLTAASASFPRMYVCFDGVDGSNGIFAQHKTAGNMSFVMINAGTQTALPTVSTDGTVAARFAIRVTGPRELKVWQGGSLIGTVTLPSSAPDIPASWKYSGFKQGGAAIASAFDDWQSAAAVIPFKDDYLRALPISVVSNSATVSLSAGRGYFSDFVGRTEGSSWNLISVVRTDVANAPTGTWNPDGTTLRANQFDGIVAGTVAVFRVTLDETKPDFANRSTLNVPNSRTSIIDVTITFTA